MSHCRTLSFFIILISASLSSNTYNKASWREDWTFEGTESIFSITLILFWTVLPKDDRTDFAQEEQPDLPYWTMILAICALVDVSKYLDILTLEFSTTSVRLPFWPGYKRIMHLLLVLRILVVLQQHPNFYGRRLWPWRFLLSEYCVRARIVFRNVSSNNNTSLYFEKFRPKLRVREVANVHQRSKMNCPSLILCLLNDLFFGPDFRLLQWQQIFELFPPFVHRWFCIWYF